MATKNKSPFDDKHYSLLISIAVFFLVLFMPYKRTMDVRSIFLAVLEALNRDLSYRGGRDIH